MIFKDFWRERKSLLKKGFCENISKSKISANKGNFNISVQNMVSNEIMFHVDMLSSRMMHIIF